MQDKLTTEMAELLYQSLETELGGVLIYQTAVAVAIREDLKKEWTKYLVSVVAEKRVGSVKRAARRSRRTTVHRQALGQFGEDALDRRIAK